MIGTQTGLMMESSVSGEGYFLLYVDPSPFLVEVLMKIKIGPFNYTIEYIGKVENKEGKLLKGRHDSNSLKILVAEKLSKEVKKAALVHEILHAVFYTYGLKRYLKSKDVDGELVVRILTTAFLALDRDNDLKKILGGK